MMQSTYRRAAAPVLFAFGPAREDSTLRAGLLFVSAELDDRPYQLFDPDDDQVPRVTVRLPADLVELSQDKFVRNATLRIGDSS